MQSETAVLSLAATLAVAALGSMWAIIKLVLERDHIQTDARHAIRKELNGELMLMEERLTKRIERLETAVQGTPAWERRTRPRGSDD